MKALGIYGGSFDPIHLGHLLLAEAAREELGLEQVIFVPAGQSPLKTHSPLVTGEQRLKLIKLAIGDHPFFTWSDVELKRKPPSYTVDTLQYFRARYPDRELYMLLGQDALCDLERWHRFRDLFQLARLAVGARPGFPPELPPALRQYERPSAHSRGIVFFTNPLIEISSRQIRARLREGRSVRYQLPSLVLAYITEKKLYQTHS
ncbi:MAG: nicotinate (nicotinamide) nucleotide adenylyltransferase [Firmicutes bacterium]|nr:nicotinate (nicotinamide) nucleotide adenylyltransferase [Bacillota bacterium]